MFSGLRFGPSLPLLWRVFLVNAAMVAAATLALAFSPATVSFPIALGEGLVLGGGLAATLGLDLLVLRRALSSAIAPATNAPLGPPPRRPMVLPPAPDPLLGPMYSRDGPRAVKVTRREVGTRLLVGWSRPYHLTDADAEAWAHAELTRVLAVAGTDSARLMRLRSASLRYPGPWDWLLELDVAPGRDARHGLESPAWRELLADLRVLETRPAAMVADTDLVLEGGRG